MRLRWDRWWNDSGLLETDTSSAEDVASCPATPASSAAPDLTGPSPATAADEPPPPIPATVEASIPLLSPFDAPPTLSRAPSSDEGTPTQPESSSAELPPRGALATPSAPPAVDIEACPMAPSPPAAPLPRPGARTPVSNVGIGERPHCGFIREEVAKDQVRMRRPSRFVETLPDRQPGYLPSAKSIQHELELLQPRPHPDMVIMGPEAASTPTAPTIGATTLAEGAVPGTDGRVDDGDRPSVGASPSITGPAEVRRVAPWWRRTAWWTLERRRQAKKFYIAMAGHPLVLAVVSNCVVAVPHALAQECFADCGGACLGACGDVVQCFCATCEDVCCCCLQ